MVFFKFKMSKFGSIHKFRFFSYFYLHKNENQSSAPPPPASPPASSWPMSIS